MLNINFLFVHLSMENLFLKGWLQENKNKIKINFEKVDSINMLCFHGYGFIKIFLCKHYAKIRHDEVNMRNSFSINFCNPSSFYSLAQIIQNSMLYTTTLMWWWSLHILAYSLFSHLEKTLPPYFILYYINSKTFYLMWCWMYNFYYHTLDYPRRCRIV